MIERNRSDLMRRTKIIATLGPASSSLEMIKDLALEGVNVFRLNMSHGDHDFHKGLAQKIRSVQTELQIPLGILIDLQGPKLRIGDLPAEGVFLKKGAKIIFDLNRALGSVDRVYFPHKECYEALDKGHRVIIGDGIISLEVMENRGDEVDFKVITEGVLGSRKGVSLPDTLLPLSPMTEKDKADLKFALSIDIDFIALSFVQRAKDIKDLRKLAGRDIFVISKIEKPQAIDDLKNIIRESDGVMVARGDLGVEMSIEQVPALQREIIRLSNEMGKPVTVATQMLESMIEAPAPTRAEVSDVANAVFEGADSVMLSGESASGKFPAETVSMMNKIIQAAEVEETYFNKLRNKSEILSADTGDAISGAAKQVAAAVSAKAIFCYTATGGTAQRISHKRPLSPIIAMTSSRAAAHKLTLYWGIAPLEINEKKTFDEVIEVSLALSQKLLDAQKGERVVITGGLPLGKPGTTNILHVGSV